MVTKREAAALSVGPADSSVAALELIGGGDSTQESEPLAAGVGQKVAELLAEEGAFFK